MTSDELRAALFDAIARRDGATFTELANAHAKTILASFATWATVPEAVRSKPEAVQAWANALIVLAETFERAGHPELMQRLLGGPTGKNPIERWRTAFEQADVHAHAGRHRDAIAQLEQLLQDMEGFTGPGVDEYRPKVYGALGVAYFRVGDLVNAERRMLDALEDCRRTHDAEGVGIYTKNLELIAAKKPSS
jgi:tetratricopeptide (TPR) repeat protein